MFPWLVRLIRLMSISSLSILVKYQNRTESSTLGSIPNRCDLHSQPTLTISWSCHQWSAARYRLSLQVWWKWRTIPAGDGDGWRTTLYRRFFMFSKGPFKLSWSWWLYIIVSIIVTVIIINKYYLILLLFFNHHYYYYYYYYSWWWWWWWWWFHLTHMSIRFWARLENTSLSSCLLTLEPLDLDQLSRVENHHQQQFQDGLPPFSLEKHEKALGLPPLQFHSCFLVSSRLYASHYSPLPGPGKSGYVSQNPDSNAHSNVHVWKA